MALCHKKPLSALLEPAFDHQHPSQWITNLRQPKSLAVRNKLAPNNLMPATVVNAEDDANARTPPRVQLGSSPPSNETPLLPPQRTDTVYGHGRAMVFQSPDPVPLSRTRTWSQAESEEYLQPDFTKRSRHVSAVRDDMASRFEMSRVDRISTS